MTCHEFLTSGFSLRKLACLQVDPEVGTLLGLCFGHSVASDGTCHLTHQQQRCFQAMTGLSETTVCPRECRAEHAPLSVLTPSAAVRFTSVVSPGLSPGAVLQPPVPQQVLGMILDLSCWQTFCHGMGQQIQVSRAYSVLSSLELAADTAWTNPVEAGTSQQLGSC